MSLTSVVEKVFSSIGHFFEHIFGVAAKDVQAVITEVGPLVNLALPIVEQLGTLVGGLDLITPSAALVKIESWLSLTIQDTSVVQNFIATNTGVPLVNLLQNAATLVLSHTSGATNTVLKDLQLAVQLAYNTFAKQNPTITGAQTVAAISAPSAKKA